MLDFLQIIACLSCTLFAGAAIYINVAEHPARLQCDAACSLKQWAPSYKRATVMQASLALVSCTTGFLVALFGGSYLWMVAGCIIGAVVPFTFMIVMPVNDELLRLEQDSVSNRSVALLKKWGRLHSVRSCLSIIAAIFYLVLLHFRY